jgi:hypothetical protein
LTFLLQLSQPKTTYSLDAVVILTNTLVTCICERRHAN